jgi:hypothetical protein
MDGLVACAGLAEVYGVGLDGTAPNAVTLLKLRRRLSAAPKGVGVIGIELRAASCPTAEGRVEARPSVLHESGD